MAINFYLRIFGRTGSSLPCSGFSLRQPCLFQGTGSRCAGSGVAVCGLSCSVACGILVPQVGIEPVFSALEGPLDHEGRSCLLFFETSLMTSTKPCHNSCLQLHQAHKKQGWILTAPRTQMNTAQGGLFWVLSKNQETQTISRMRSKWKLGPQRSSVVKLLLSSRIFFSN